MTIQVSAIDLDTGDVETSTLVDYVLVVNTHAGYYLAGTVNHANGTTTLTIKRRPDQAPDGRGVELGDVA